MRNRTSQSNKKLLFILVMVLSVLCVGAAGWAKEGKVVLTAHPQGNEKAMSAKYEGGVRIIYGIVDGVQRNLVKVDKDTTEGISPRYLDIGQAKVQKPVQPGDHLKMKVNLHNQVVDYWIMKGNSG